MDVSATQQTLGQDDFLKLFVTQMKYQNPLNPMDSTEFTAQLAQFSSLEQLTNISGQLNNLSVYENSLNNTLTTTFIGRKVEFAGDSLYLKGNADIGYSLSAGASDVKITISDSSGKVVREIDAGARAAGSNTYSWDGKDSLGNALPDGNYSIRVDAYDAAGNTVDSQTQSSGTVTGVSFDNNVTSLIIDGTTRINLSDISKIS
jgi:flagellar basal-body rod modification protein FlgD